MSPQCIRTKSMMMNHDEIPNDQLTLEDIPPPGADWGDLGEFALTYNGYVRQGSFEICAKIADAKRHRTLSELRTCLFFENRRWHHFGDQPDAAAMTYLWEVLEKIRAKVEAGDRS